MLECSKCAQNFIPSTSDFNICPHCGHADGEGMLHLQEEAELGEADQLTQNTLIRTMGKLSLLLLMVVIVSIVLFGYAAIDDQSTTMTETTTD
jgi:hypothetical protein